MEYAPSTAFPLSITGPIVVVEDDEDDQFILNKIFSELQIAHLVTYFVHPLKALDYLLEQSEQPFLILSDINLPVMNGIEFKRKIDQHPVLRNRSIPFVFMSTAIDKKVVAQAYKEFSIQGFFQKSDTYEQVKQSICAILFYWQLCVHPNNT